LPFQKHDLPPHHHVANVTWIHHRHIVRARFYRPLLDASRVEPMMSAFFSGTRENRSYPASRLDAARRSCHLDNFRQVTSCGTSNPPGLLSRKREIVWQRPLQTEGAAH